MSDKENMDKSVREKLEAFSVAPPPHVWNNIQGQMAAQQRKRRIALIGWISAAAVVVLAFIAGWYFNENNRHLDSGLVQNQAEERIEPQEDRSAQEQTIIVDEIVLEEEEDVLLSETNIAVSTLSTENAEPALIENVERNEATAASLLASVEKVNYKLLQSIEAVLNITVPDVSLKEPPSKQQYAGLSAADEVLIASNVKNISGKKNVERGWIIGAYISPAYSSHSASYDESYAQNITYSSDNGGGNVGGGFSVQYKTSKRLRVESGIYYSKDGQKANNSLNLFAFNNDMDYAAAPEANYVGSDEVFASAVQTSPSGIEMNTTAGVIKMSSTPEGAEIATELEALDSRTENTLYANGEFSQVFEFVEVPLYLRYCVLDKRFGIELLGGINAGFVVGNNAYLDNQYGLQNIGSTNDISTLNLSGTMGLGFSYMLGKHLSVAVEPRLNYYLNSINSNSEVDYRPYRIGVFTGVSYEF